MAEPLAPGQQAPDFRLGGSDGRTYALSEILADGAALLLFYPGNDTPG